MRPQDLNYQHLRYFHAVAHEGSVLRASRVLGLAPSTVSGQIKSLEAELGQPLLERVGRGLVLTPFGEETLRVADQIFELGAMVVRQASSDAHRERVRVGISAVLPKLLVRDILASPSTEGAQLMLSHGHTDDLLGRLAARKVDVVLADTPVPAWVNIAATSHLVLTSDIALFGSPELHARVADDLPRSLGTVPWLLPPSGTTLRTGIESWWEERGILPDIACEVDDSALMKALGDAGMGVFAAPERMLDAVLEGYRVACIGVIHAIQERVYAITRESTPDSRVVRGICGMTETGASLS